MRYKVITNKAKTEKVYVTASLASMIRNATTECKASIANDIAKKMYIYEKSVKPGIERAQLIHKEIDKLAQHNGEISCKRGCFGCCHQLQSITADEVELITDKHSDKIDKKVLTEQVKLFDEVGGDADKWFINSPEKTRCVFLKNNECSIYSDRPLSCRNYFVVSDSKLCYPGGESPDVSVASTYKREIVVSAAYNLSGLGYLPVMLNKKL